MTSTLWKRLCERHGIKVKFSSAHHPKTDGQTKNANKVMKNYLRAYISYTQDDWVDHLPMGEFLANNHVNESTGMISFFADNGFHLRTSVEPPQHYQRGQRAELLAADRIVANQEETVSYLQDQLTWSQQEQAHWANQNRRPHLEYKVGDMVYVDARHFSASKGKSKLLSLKNAGPWKIIRNIANKAYELDILQQMKEAGLTPVFHPWKLHFAPSDPFPDQVLEPGPAIIVEDDDHDEWEVLEVVDSRKTKRYGIQYKATYMGNWDEWNSNPPWQPYSDFENSKEKIREFHRTHSQKPGPASDLVI